MAMRKAIGMVTMPGFLSGNGAAEWPSTLICTSGEAIIRTILANVPHNMPAIAPTAVNLL